MHLCRAQSILWVIELNRLGFTTVKLDTLLGSNIQVTDINRGDNLDTFSSFFDNKTLHAAMITI